MKNTLGTIGEPHYMNQQDTAKYLGISVSTLKKWVKVNGFPCATIGGVRRFSKIAVDQFMGKEATE